MKKQILKNGLTVIFKARKTETVAVEICVKLGSNDEPSNLKGASHFIEHLLFEGTKNRTAFEISNEIEGMGGEIGGFTANERTCFYVKTLPKHFEKAIDVLSDVIQNPLFSEGAISKERTVVLSEVSMMHDQPRFYQWELFQKTLFEKHPARIPIIGTEKTLKAMTRKDLVGHYSSFYVPNNIIITVVGNVSDPVKIIERKFSFKKGKDPLRQECDEPRQSSPKNAVEKRQIEQSYLILGYKAVPRTHKDSYALDVVRAVLGRGLSGRLFTEIRTKRGLGYDVGAHYEANAKYGFFATYVSTDKKNLDICKDIILKEFENLSNLTPKELGEAKNFLEGEFLIENEDNQRLADTLSFCETTGNASASKQYTRKIRAVAKADVVFVVKKYLNKDFTCIVLKQ